MKKKSTKDDIKLLSAGVAIAAIIFLMAYNGIDALHFMVDSVSAMDRKSASESGMNGSLREGGSGKCNADKNSSKTMRAEGDIKSISQSELIDTVEKSSNEEAEVSEEQQIRKLVAKINRSIPLMYELEYTSEQNGVTHGFLSGMYYALKDTENGPAIIKAHIDVQMALQQRTDIVIAGKSPNDEEPTPQEKILFRMADIYHASLKSEDNYTSSGYHEAYVLLLEEIWDRTITDYETFQNRVQLHLLKYSLPMPLR
jgi:hypothetical protein